MGSWFRWIKKLYENMYNKLEGLKGGFPTFGTGVTYFVDSDTDIGVDTNSGLAPDKALLTITAALAKCVDEHDDVIIVRGNFSESITISKEKVHLFGIMGKGPNQAYETRINPGAAATQATILIQADDVEVAYLQVLGERGDPGYPAIFADGENGGSRSNIHDVVIATLTQGASTYCDGIHLTGNRHSVSHVIIDAANKGILIDEEGGVTTYRIKLEDIKMTACNIGLHVFATSPATSRHNVMAQDLHIDGYQAQAASRAITLDGTSNNVSILRAHMEGYGNQAATVTEGNGKFSDCTFCDTTGVSSAMA